MIETPSPPLFNAVLYPHRSLDPRGFAILMAACGGAVLLVGLWFATLGAWPVLPFFGCEIALIWWAFRANNRDARMFETVRLTTQELTVEQVRPSGRKFAHRFAPPHWLRVDLAQKPDGSNALHVGSHGRALEIGRFLSPEERREVAAELRAALGRLSGRPPQ